MLLYIKKTWLAPSAGQGWPSVPVAMTQTGRLRLERRHGWQGAGMARRDLPESLLSD